MSASIRQGIEKHATKTQNTYLPLFFRIQNETEQQAFEKLLASEPTLFVHNTIEAQLKELIKNRNPSKVLLNDEYPALISAHLKGIDLLSYGVWVYYPWKHKLVHLLDEKEFIEIRTTRNQYKITAQEQAILATKKIGVVGLSVGQSIAVTLAMERACGELRLADFDSIDLSNLNRIRTSVDNLGLNKAVIVAREIAEIDPYLKVRIFPEGLNAENMDAFFVKEGNLDLLVEVCDGFDIKIQSRLKARALSIPVIMDTNDRGMIDIERFDLEPNRPLLHGLIEGIDPSKLSTLSSQEKIPILMKMVNAEKASKRGKASLMEIEQSITTWPQLASSVVLGGAMTTDVTRRMFLGQFNDSGRFYVDLEAIINDQKSQTLTDTRITKTNPHLPLSKEDMEKSIEGAALKEKSGALDLEIKQLHAIVKAATAAPSTGNDQPWKWYYHQKKLYLFHEQCRSFSFGDYRKMASYLTFGAVYENVVLAAHQLHLEVDGQMFPLGHENALICAFNFTTMPENAEPHSCDDLADFIYLRNTNRNLSTRQEIAPEILKDLKNASESIEGAHLTWLTDIEKIIEAGKIVGIFDRMRLLNEYGHQDFINREIRWSTQDAERTKDGIDVLSLGLSPSQVSALEIIKDYQAMAFLKQFKGGRFFETAALRSIKQASAIGLITMPKASPENYIQGGRSFERLWLTCEKHNVALHPIITPLYFFPRLDGISDSSLSEEELLETKVQKKNFIDLFKMGAEQAGVFLFKLSYAGKPEIKSLRLPVREVLFS